MPFRLCSKGECHDVLRTLRPRVCTEFNVLRLLRGFRLPFHLHAISIFVVAFSHFSITVVNGRALHGTLARACARDKVADSMKMLLAIPNNPLHFFPH